MEKDIYLDNSATTRPYDEVIEYMSDVYRNHYGNPSSLHKKGIEAEHLIMDSRRVISQSLGVQSKEIFFTSGGTEANNIAIGGFVEGNTRGGRHIITSSIEHPAVLEVFKNLKSKQWKVDILPVDSKGIIRLDKLEELITDETSFVSIMLVNNETGAISPFDDIVRIIKMRNRATVIHADAVQAYGKIKINPLNLGIDMLSVSSHKIHGPKGVGALYVNGKIKIKPIIFGGGQEHSLRSGTENVAGIAGFGLAASRIIAGIGENFEKILNLNEYFRNRILEELPDARIISPMDALPYILSVSFGSLRAEVLLHHLEEKNIFVSTGSACASRKKSSSHVLNEMGISSNDINSTIRFSFNAQNTKEELDITMEALKLIIPKITYGLSKKGRRP